MKKNNPTGFTLVELLVAVVIFTTIGIFTFVNVAQLRQKQIFTNAVEELVGALRVAQSNTIASTPERGTTTPSNWGVIIARDGNGASAGYQAMSGPFRIDDPTPPAQNFDESNFPTGTHQISLPPDFEMDVPVNWPSLGPNHGILITFGKLTGAAEAYRVGTFGSGYSTPTSNSYDFINDSPLTINLSTADWQQNIYIDAQGNIDKDPIEAAP